MSEMTPISNELLREYQRFAKEGYAASQLEWASFGAKAVSALYKLERSAKARAALEQRAERMKLSDTERQHYERLIAGASYWGEYFHADYGPCDALGPEYSCSECGRKAAALEERVEEMEARFPQGLCWCDGCTKDRIAQGTETMKAIIADAKDK